MSNMRVRYGWALGPEGTYAANSGLTLIIPGDTTPDVTTGVLFYTNNTSATTITAFDVLGPGGQNGTSANQGKIITVFFRDALTTITPSSTLQLSGASGAIPAGTISEFIFHNGGWYEFSRETPSATSNVSTITVGGTIAPNVAGLSMLIINATAATTIIGLSGGSLGQEVTIVKNAASAGTGLTLTGAANFWLAGTSAIVTSDSGAYKFINDDGTRFRSVGGIVVP